MSDRDTLDELEELLIHARNKAHWLHVHRRMRLAGHIEDLLKIALRLCYDVAGRHARKEPL
jgi:hypothetical protein